MKKYIYFTLLLFSVISCKQPSKKQIDYKEIESVLDRQLSAWHKGNIDGFMEGYWHSDSLQFITKNGVRRGYDSVCNNYKRHYDTPEKRGHLSFIDLKFETLDETAEIVQCSGRWHIAANAVEQEQSGMFSLIFKKINGEWKIIIDHTW